MSDTPMTPDELADALDGLTTDWEQRNTDDLRAAAGLLRAVASERDTAYLKLRELDERLDACPSQDTLDYYHDALERAYAERDDLRAQLDARTDPGLAARLNEAAQKYDGRGVTKGFVDLADVAAAAQMIGGEQ